MKKRELRLAVVFYGGVPLAVYMHGITKEVQKLVRASKVLHSLEATQRATVTCGEVVTLDNFEELVSRGPADGRIDAVQASLVRAAQRASRAVVEVDSFTRDYLESGFLNATAPRKTGTAA